MNIFLTAVMAILVILFIYFSVYNIRRLLKSGTRLSLKTDVSVFLKSIKFRQKPVYRIAKIIGSLVGFVISGSFLFLIVVWFTHIPKFADIIPEVEEHIPEARLYYKRYVSEKSFVLRDRVLTSDVLAEIAADNPEITRLSLESCRITDFSPLTKLTKLTELNLSLNDITDVSPLSAFTKLTYLNLGYNEITDISPLAKLTNLTDLDLHGNKITDISVLAKLKNLENLELGNNDITDFSPIESLPNYEIEWKY